MTQTQQQSAETETPAPSRWRSAWAVRAYLSTIGQSMLLYSGLKNANAQSNDKSALVGFASVNLLANAINAIFGGQKKSDPHQLRYLKQKINDELAPLSNTALPSVDATLDQSSGKAQGESQTHYMLQKYSVIASEFVLRTAGSLSLIAPVTGWRQAARNLRGGMSVKETFALARSKNPVTFGAGLFSLAGKGFILAASEPDPYNPEPLTPWRSMREKLMFRLSSISEVIGGAWMGHDRFSKQQNLINGKLQRDYYGAVGNASIITGYIPRWIAPYGTREVVMPELYAHAAAALDSVTTEKREPAKQQIIGELAEHFKDKNISEQTIQREIESRMKPSPRISASSAEHAVTIQQPTQGLSERATHG